MRSLTGLAIAVLVATPLLFGGVSTPEQPSRATLDAPQRVGRTDGLRDTSDVRQFLSGVRGGTALQCELSVHTIDQQFGWRRYRLTPDASDAAHALMHRALQQIEDPAAVPMLAAALTDADGCVRRLAARLLGRSRMPEAIDALTDALRSTDDETRVVAAVGLGRAELRETAQTLIDALSDSSPQVRTALAWALGRIEVREAETALVTLLQTDRDARVRQAAAWALGDMF